MQFLQKLRNNKGSSLVVVLVAFAVLVIMGLTLISVASYGHKTTFHYHKKQQAQYTARFVMDTMTKSLANPGISAKLITSVKAGNKVVGSGNLTTENLGTYQVTVDPPVVPTGGTKPMMKVTVLADFQGVPYSLSAYYKEGKGDRMNPMDFLFFCKGAEILKEGGDTNQTVYDGNVYVNAAANYNNILFKQKFLTFGTSNFMNGSMIEGDLIISGNFSPNAPNPAIYKGDVYQEGKNDPLGNPITYIGFTANVQLHQKKWTSIRYKAEHTASNIVFGIGTFADATKGITCKQGEVIYPDGTVNSMWPLMASYPSYSDSKATITYVGGGVFEIDYGGRKDKIDANFGVELYTADNGETLKYSVINNVISNVSSVFGPPNVSSKPTATLSGTITAGVYRVTTASTVGDVVLDTSGGDIHLYFSSNLQVNNNITITGTENVYFHIGSNKMTVLSGKSVGQNGKVEHQLFVEGNNANLELGAESTFKGCAYLGDGKFKDSGLLTSGKKIEGSITAKEIITFAGNVYTYVDYLKEPDLDATLVNPVAGGDPYKIISVAASTEKDWKLVKYDN